MSYMLLIVEPQGQRRLRSPQEGRELYERMLEYTAGLKARGVLLGSDSLRAESVRLDMRAGRRSVTDGPFTEAKELVGGFFLLDCPTRRPSPACRRTAGTAPGRNPRSPGTGRSWRNCFPQSRPSPRARPRRISPPALRAR